MEHIVLTTHAYEHKIFVPAFQRRYSNAKVWVVPRCASRYILVVDRKERVTMCDKMKTRTGRALCAPCST